MQQPAGKTVSARFPDALKFHPEEKNLTLRNNLLHRA
jgi:hypothetical protein